MKTFTKKTDITLLILSLFFLFFGSVIILFSNSFILILKDFLENVVFHEAFELEKWYDTLLSIFAFPIFCVLLVDAVLFPKFSNKTKIIIISFVFALIAIFTVYFSAAKSMSLMDSDMASEILLAKECWLEKSLFPIGWHYSTEIRLINTQLISAPIFIFTNNWIIVKTLTVIIVCALYSLSLLFLLNQLEIKQTWIKLLCCLLVFSPWSFLVWKYVLYGSYYIPHIAISFIYIGLFISLIRNQNTPKKQKIYSYLFWFFAFYSGLSSIRYIIYFVFPVAAVMNYYAITNLSKNHLEFNFKKYFIEDKNIFYSTFGLVLSGFGYLFNTFILAHFYSFSNFNTTAFRTIGDVKLVDFYAGLMDLLGYKNEVSVLTPCGLSDLLLYVALVFFFICLFISINKKSKLDYYKKLFLIISVVMFAFDSFVYIKTEYIIRYFLLLIPYIIPCFAIFISNDEISILKKYILGVSLSVCLLTNSFYTFETVINTSYTKDKTKVTQFLKDNNLNFGYATFWNANVFTYLSNGQIELANLYRKDINDNNYLQDEYDYDNWLTPKRYYKKDDSTKNVFLLIDSHEYELNYERNVIKNGKLIYEDDYYKVYLYDTLGQFKESFNNTN